MKINIKNLIYYFIFFILLLFCFMPPYITHEASNITNICKVFQIGSIVFFTILNIKENKGSRATFIVLLYYLVLLSSTIVNNISFMVAINNAIKTLSVCLLVDYGVRKQPRIFLKSFEIIFSVFLMFNVITVLKYPNGLYMNPASGLWQNWFLGYKNSHILYIFPLVLVSFLNSLLDGKFVTSRNVIIMILSFLNIIIVQSSTSYTMIIGIVVYILCYRMLNKSTKFHAKNYFYTYITSFTLITVLRISNWLRFIVVNLFKKDLTFTGRTKIWDLAIEQILNKPILGHGEKTFVYNTNYNVRITSTHSELLEIFFKTGLVGGLVYLFLIWKSAKNLYQYREKMISKYLAITLLIFLIMTLFEAYTLDKCMYLFMVYFNVEYLININSGEGRKEE